LGGCPVIRIKLAHEFEGDGAVVLLAADGAGLDALTAALTEAKQRGSSRLHGRHRVHEFVVDVGAANLEIGPDRVLWRLDDAKAGEILDGVDALSNGGAPGHVYVDDMISLAPTLVLSRDEYLTPSWLTAGKEPMFDDDSPD